MSESKMEKGRLFNVMATDNSTGKERVLVENKLEEDADAIVAMAVMRRGVEEEHFYTKPVNPGAGKEGV